MIIGFVMNGELGTEVLGFKFDDLYEPQAITLALADLISKDDKDKLIISAHSYGCNNISEVSKESINQEERDKVFSLKESEASDPHIQKKWAEISKNLIAKEFKAMFALLEKHKRPIAHIRWMPKDDEIYASARPNPKGHYVCLYFFYDHNNEKSILIANPNGHEIQDEHEAAVISSYLQKHKEVKIYQSKDYLQFDNATCGPGALIILRMLYNIQKEDFHKVLQNGERNVQSKFSYTSIELGHDALQKEIGKVPKSEEEEKDMDQKLRLADYKTAKLCEENKIKTSFDENSPRFTFDHIEFNQELTKDLSKDQAILLSKFLLSGKQLLTTEQIQQVNHKREESLDAKDKKTVKIQLDDGRIKDPKTTLSNEGARPHQHTRDNVRRKSSSDTQHTEKSEPVKISLVAIAFVAAVVFFISIFADVKKEFKIAGIVISSIMLISAVTCLCLPKKPKSMIIDNGVIPETVPILQQPSQK